MLNLLLVTVVPPAMFASETLQPSAAFAPEPVATPYEVGAPKRDWVFDIVADLSPAGIDWRSDAGTRFAAVARVAPGLWLNTKSFGIFGGLCYQLSTASLASFGGELRVAYATDKAGIAFHAGGIVDTSGRPGFFSGATYTIIGLEYQQQDLGAATSHMVLLNAWLPLRLLYLSLEE